MVGHGDTISGTVLAGGICAARLRRERTGVASIVDGSLLEDIDRLRTEGVVA